MLSVPGSSDSLTLEEVKSQIYARNNPTLTPVDIEMHASTVHRILELKKKHNVFMLGHNYMEPLVFGLSTEKEQGDSLALSMKAVETDSDIIIFNGVRFMAETAKVLNPNKTILIADKNSGCSLADDFGAEQVRELKAQNPGVPVMIYINSYAEAKAECDVCCTSANAEKIAMEMPGDELIFVPDLFFAQNLENVMQGKKKIIYPGKDNNTKGAVCEVHEKFSLQDIIAMRESFGLTKGHPNRMLYVHWECKPEVLQEADYYGSTTQIRNHIATRVEEGTLEKAYVASECELTSNLMEEFPTVEFGTACSVRCNHMAKISLDKIKPILEAIDSGSDLSKWEVNLSDEIISKAAKPIERMLSFS
ncbi:MAG: quinolinate synthase [Candidatus Thermoplasmatota archaeon]|nr:quinolinate synthase [Candidatus Thermoplasmatota archaeon]